MEKGKKPLSISINKVEESAKDATVVNDKKNVEVKIIETAPKVEAVKTPTIPSIEELQAKAEKTSLLVQRYQTIKGKKADIDGFVILMDNSIAKVTLTDQNGNKIHSHNPKSILQVVDIWKSDINEALIKAEQEVREIMGAQQIMPEALKQAA